MARIGNEDPLHPNGREIDLRIPQLIDDQDRPIWDHIVPILDYLNPGITKPQMQAPHFKLKPVMFHMLQNVGQFSGLPTEDP